MTGTSRQAGAERANVHTGSSVKAWQPVQRLSQKLPGQLQPPGVAEPSTWLPEPRSEVGCLPSTHSAGLCMPFHVLRDLPMR